MSGRTFLDTNVLVYAFDDADVAKRDRARELLSDADQSYVISAQVIGEFYVAVTRRLAKPLPAENVSRAVEQMRQLPVVPIDAQLAVAATRRSDASQLSYWDALIVEAARSAGCGLILSEDFNSGQSYGGVVAVDPFSDRR